MTVKLFFRHRTGSNHSRRAVVLVIVIVLAAISLALFGSWGRAIVLEHRRLANYPIRLQAVRLAEAGLERLRVQRAIDPEFQQELWTVPAEQLDGVNRGEVRSRVHVDEERNVIMYEATAVFPVGVTRRAQITKQFELPQSDSRTTP